MGKKVFTCEGLRLFFHGQKSNLDLPKNFETFVGQLTKKVIEVGSRKSRKNCKSKTCTYAGDGSGHGRCIVGQAIMELYPRLYQELRKFEKTYDFSAPISEVTTTLYEKQKQFNIAHPNLTFLTNVQGRQDGGEKWGRIIEEEAYA